MLKAILVQFSAVALASGLVTAYHLDPKTASMSGKAHPVTGVSEVITCNFDEPITASLFVGTLHGSGLFNVDIYAYPGGANPLAYAHDVAGALDHHWLPCSLTVQYPDSFIKGRQVEVRWTRGGSDSIQFYYQDNDPYPHGLLIAQLPDPVPLDWDLCMRLYAQLDPVDSTTWGTGAFFEEQCADKWLDTMRTLGVRRCDLLTYWDTIQHAGYDSFDFSGMGLDSHVVCLKALGCEPAVRPELCPNWASSRFESVDTTDVPPETVWSEY